MADPVKIMQAIEDAIMTNPLPVPPPAPRSIDAILAERGKTHGEYTEHADITQRLKEAMRDTRNWREINPVQRETLEMIAHKVGRILAGNPNTRDHWDDIAGYARLAADRVK